MMGKESDKEFIDIVQREMPELASYSHLPRCIINASFHRHIEEAARLSLEERTDFDTKAIAEAASETGIAVGVETAIAIAIAAERVRKEQAHGEA